MRVANVRLGTGPKLKYVECGNPAGDPLLFLHGWPDSWFTYSRILPLLPPDLRLLAIDQRGFGDSEHPDSGYEIPGMAADVLAFLDALDIERAVLVGHSYGSFVARSATIQAPTRVGRLVLIGTGFAASSEVILELREALRDIPDPIPEQFAREFQASTAYLPLPDDFFDGIIAETLKLPARLWSVMIEKLLEYDDEAELAKLALPVLLLWGDQDALFPRPHQDRIAAALPNAQLTVYEQTGHCPNWERPERVASDVSDFVKMRK